MNSNKMSDYPFDVFQIDKISKDGTKARGMKGSLSKDFPIEVQDCRKTLLQYMDENHIKNPVLALMERRRYFGIWESSVREDDYDDIVHFSLKAQTIEYKAAHIGDIPNEALLGRLFSTDGYIPVYYAKTPGDMADYIVERFSLRTKAELKERFDKWIQENGSEHTDISSWKDYNGAYSQLEWAISNNVCTVDYDEWQAVQRILKHELRFETAMDITKALYEKEDLNIFDCE